MPYVLLIWCYSTGSVKHVTMTYQSMSTCIAIIVHHCVTNQNPLTDDSQAESQSQMCKSYNSDQHRPCCESWYGLKSTEAPFFHVMNITPHMNPQKQQNRALLVMTRLRLRYFWNYSVTLQPKSVSDKSHCCHACNRIKWVCRIWPVASSETFFCWVKCKHTL